MGKPIVLIVDDEPEFGMQLKKLFANAAEWGTLFIDDLAEAFQIIESQRYEIKILLTDWHFTKGTDVDLGLLDGVDLVEKTQKNCPSVECFLMTAQQNSPNFEAKSASLNSVRIMFKMDFEMSRLPRMRESFSSGEKDDRQPWSVIASNIGENVIQMYPDVAHLGKKTATGSQFETFIQEMPKGIRVAKPIPIVVKVDSDEGGIFFKASAPQLGLLVEGIGSDPMEAIDELKDVIYSQVLSLNEVNLKDLKGLAALSMQLLEDHLAIDTVGTEQVFHYG
ncbi:CheY-like chemotaxis protein [Labrenzia sp. EL_195]|nr:CheY-like chemotaxis protein [Labrenzia sp. EL_195]